MHHQPTLTTVGRHTHRRHTFQETRFIIFAGNGYSACEDTAKLRSEAAVVLCASDPLPSQHAAALRWQADTSSNTAGLQRLSRAYLCLAVEDGA